MGLKFKKKKKLRKTNPNPNPNPKKMIPAKNLSISICFDEEEKI